ncbi:MAG: sodium/proton-translocating pyrophosphatase, partial [Polyangiaceae bacterium]
MKSTRALPAFLSAFVFGLLSLLVPATAFAQEAGGEAALKVPALDDASVASFFGMSGARLLTMGLGVCALGMLFGLMIYSQLKNAPVHKSMLEISELIYETCKTYLVTQMKFIGMLWALIGAVIFLYFFVLEHFPITKVLVILAFSVLGILG